MGGDRSRARFTEPVNYYLHPLYNVLLDSVTEAQHNHFMEIRQGTVDDFEGVKDVTLLSYAAGFPGGCASFSVCLIHCTF